MSRIEIVDAFITTLNRERKLRIYLPENHDSVRCPVLYMHDGQNLFSDEDAAYGESWGVKAAADAYYRQHGKGLIIVGIDNGEIYRFDEYSPWISNKLKKYIPELGMDFAGGEGDKYLDWLVRELIPMINQKCRTNHTNYLAGSSMGANITLYAGIKYPGVFRKLGCLSPAFWFSLQEFARLIKASALKDLEVYLDIGTKESRMITNPELRHAKRIYRLLKKKDCKAELLIEKGALHRESAWKRRFPGFLSWLLDE